jgi:hypothetical protein
MWQTGLTVSLSIAHAPTMHAPTFPRSLFSIHKRLIRINANETKRNETAPVEQVVDGLSTTSAVCKMADGRMTTYSCALGTFTHTHTRALTHARTHTGKSSNQRKNLGGVCLIRFDLSPQSRMRARRLATRILECHYCDHYTDTLLHDQYLRNHCQMHRFVSARVNHVDAPPTDHPWDRMHLRSPWLMGLRFQHRQDPPPCSRTDDSHPHLRFPSANNRCLHENNIQYYYRVGSIDGAISAHIYLHA